MLGAAQVGAMNPPRIPRPAAFSAPQFGLLMLVGLALWGGLWVGGMVCIAFWRMLGWMFT